MVVTSSGEGFRFGVEKQVDQVTREASVRRQWAPVEVSRLCRVRSQEEIEGCGNLVLSDSLL